MNGFASAGRKGRRTLDEKRASVWLHPAVYWTTGLGSIVATGFVLAAPGPHGLPWKIAAVSVLSAAVLILGVNDLMVRARSRRGWRPIVGVHGVPKLKKKQSPIAVLWRWTLHRRARQDEVGSGRSRRLS